MYGSSKGGNAYVTRIEANEAKKPDVIRQKERHYENYAKHEHVHKRQKQVMAFEII